MVFGAIVLIFSLFYFGNYAKKNFGKMMEENETANDERRKSLISLHSRVGADGDALNESVNSNNDLENNAMTWTDSNPEN